MGFRRYGLRGGVGLTIVSLLIAAANAENQQEQRTMTEMIFFILDPHGEERKEKVSHELVKHLSGHKKFGTKAAIDRELGRMMRTVDVADKRGRVKEEDVKELALATIGTIADETGMVASKSLQVNDPASSDDD